MKKFLRLAAAFVIAVLIAALLALEAFAAGGEQERADAFIEAVLQIGDTTTIYDEGDAINYAKSEGVYFDDTAYPGVAEALSTLAAKEAAHLATVAACEDFVEYMSIAEELDYSGGSYTELRAALDRANEYIRAVDKTYFGVNSYLELYSQLTAELVEPEKTSKSYISCAERAVAAEDYKNKKQAYDDAMQFFDGAIPDYPGVSEATAALLAVDAELDEIVKKANRFKLAVAAIGSGDNLYAEISAAYTAFSGVDETVTGVRASKSLLLGLVSDIQAQVEAINEALGAIVSVVAPIEADSGAPVSCVPALLPRRRGI